MPIVVGDLSGIGQGIQTAGSALAGALQNRNQNRMQQQQMGQLDQALAGADLTTQQGQQNFLRQAISAKVPIQDALGILDRAIKQQSASQQGFQTQDPEQLSGLFSRLGMSPDVAEDYAQLYGNLSQGGRTAFANMFIDKLQRGDIGKTQQQVPQARPGPGIGEPIQPLGDLADVEPQEEGFMFEDVNIFEGLTPKEKVGRQKDLFNANAKDFNEVALKTKSLKDDNVRVSQLERYNNSGRLPEGMEKLNINWKTGDIRFPALANPETQGFVKTINDFTVKAKETFGARVTNFELGAFMKRLPTMANSTEGRRLIIDQMKAMGDLDRLYYDSLSEVYDHYGLRGVDKQKAERIASELRAPKEEALKQKVADSTSAQEAYDLKIKLPDDYVLIEFNGKKGGVPQSQVDAAVRKGARVL